MKPSANPDGSRTAAASIAAMGSIILAWSCCMPILPFVFAAGFAGSSAMLTTLRPYLLGASIVLVGYGFFQAWRARQCNRRPSVVTSLLLWTAALFIAASIFVPEFLANAAASLLAR